ncbi:M28 family peptidase [Sulfitobacter geojensis]|uniref:Carboxypeptidase Q n=1 Tax=Sulfitobacter geojensis TaxID=1342299 RepID=A0AAE2W0E8_9RHOB|nr:M28 family peptidase [Sulfitobacter geojensis]MBM1690955.1 M28 family peptidase [Sulfitobacter geojensis]MBM1695021.1 M28 family peptidase [Sulfitobacter geojensis]MBM1707094.1 M28 family peptidase [Sulfitobacter geojensis]MBM1711244.1 M28 family peptidase [Sulfitobacter geojensis]MBM1715219.1 M28 family peptidase [Sulfitobacter geojensis]
MNQTEKDLLEQVTIDAPWALVESFATFKREHPDDVNRGMDEVVNTLRGHGVEVQVHEPELYLSLPGQARVEADGTTFRAKPPAYAVNTPNGLSGPLVYIPGTTNMDEEDAFESQLEASAEMEAKVRGKIVLTEGFASPAIISLMGTCGAIGVIAINPGVDIHWGICTTIWGTPGTDDLPNKPTIPAAAVNFESGQALRAIAEAGGEATIFTEMEEGWFTSKLPEITIPGTEEPEKYVLLHGHLDSWDVGVGDNATGDASMLEIARVLWANKDKLRRTVKIVWWPGHSTGRYAGSTWYSDTFALDLDANCVAQVNCDSPGCRWATEFLNVSVMSENHDYLAQVIKDVCGKELHSERPHRAGDYSFNNIGLSGYLMLSSAMTDAHREELGYYAVGGCGMNIAWHTENDTLEIADKDILLRDIKVYLLAVFRNANAAVLPQDWRATAREFQDTLATYQFEAGDAFDLSDAKAASDSLLSKLNAFYDGVADGSVSEARANIVIQDLARILVPLNFNRSDRFRHDPALTIPPLPALDQASKIAATPADLQGFGRTQLVRGQNHVIAGMRSAETLIERVAGV